MNKDTKVCNPATVAIAFLSGAGIAATAFLVARKVRQVVSPTAEHIIKKCDRAFEALDSQIAERLAV